MIEIFESENIFGARALPRALRAMISATQMSFFGHFFEKRKLRADGARAQVRARKFGARHRIENQKSYILCIYNILISLKVAEIERLEVF